VTGAGRRDRRFYAGVDVAREAGGFRLLLDGRVVRTPARNILEVTTRPLADAIAAEWASQGERIDPARMPLTGLANSALDGVRGREGAVIDEIVQYAGADLVCYRATCPRELEDLQREHWDPLLAWLKGEIGARLATTEGVVHIAQPAPAIRAIEDALGAFDAFALTALHNMVTLTGSAVLALALVHAKLRPGEAWSAAHVDENWQIARWGEDGEAAERRQQRWREFEASHLFFELSRTAPA